MDFAGGDVAGGEDGLLMAPAYAVPRMLERAGLGIADFDLVEIHEAFASQVLATLAAWEKRGLAPVDRARLNVAGSSSPPDTPSRRPAPASWRPWPRSSPSGRGRGAA